MVTVMSVSGGHPCWWVAVSLMVALGACCTSMVRSVFGCSRLEERLCGSWGLVRFDGARFEVFDTERVPALGSNRIVQLLHDLHGIEVVTAHDRLARRKLH